MRKKIILLLLIAMLLILTVIMFNSSRGVKTQEITDAMMLKELRAIDSIEARNFTTEYLTKDGAFTLKQKSGVRELVVHPRNFVNNEVSPKITIYSYPQKTFSTGLALGRTIICSSKLRKNECIDITIGYLDPMGSFTKDPLPKSYFGLTRREIMQITNQYLPTHQRLANIIAAYENELKNGPLYNYLKVEGELRCVGWAKDKKEFTANQLIFYGCFDQDGYQSGSMGTGDIIKSSRSYQSRLTPFPAKVILLAKSHPFSPFALKFLNTVESIESEYIISLSEEPLLP